MAQRKKYTLSDFPDDGTVFAVPLADGRTGVCRILRKEDKGIPCILVAASDWISNEPPTLDHSAIRRILIKNHHNWVNAPEVMWISTPPPKKYRTIGKIAADSNGAKAESNSYGGWDSLAIQILAQWRWDNEREAVLAEDEEKRKIQLAARNEAIQKRADYLSTVSFGDLLAKDLFPTWGDYPPKEARDACQKIVRSFIHVLAKTQVPLEQDFVSNELKKCIQGLNKLDSQNNNFIETVEREDLCEVLEDVVNAAKFPGLIEEVENWRDW